MALDPDKLFDALKSAQERGLLPTTLGTADLRELGEDLLARSVFAARLANADVVSVLKDVIDQVAAGDMDEATARVMLLEAIKATGYTPEGGFPDTPAGAVPPAIRGTLQDLTSFRRLKLIVETQRVLMRGRGQQMRGSSPERLAEFPAWELVREISVEVPRNWGGSHTGEVRGKQKFIDPRPRWTIAGGRIYGGNRLIALKGDPVWGELGSKDNFEDALGVDHPPFAFNSGMGWEEVGRRECIRLGVVGPNGESIDEWQSQERVVINGKMPAIQGSVRTMDEDVRRELEKQTGGTIKDGTLTVNAIEARQDDILKRAIAARNKELEGRR